MNSTVAFLHMPKCGGITLRSIMMRQWTPWRVFPWFNEHSIESFKQLPISAKQGIRCAIGHYTNGLHKLLPSPTIQITMLREPLDRVMSFYSFVVQTPNHYLYDKGALKSMPFDAFVQDSEIIELSNLQVRLLAGVNWSLTNPNACCVSRQALEAAKENLMTDFAVFGLTERFDETLVLFKHQLGWSDIFYARKNVSRRMVTKAELSKETMNVIQERNGLDIELYEFAKARFEECLEAQGPRFQEQVENFRRANSSCPAARIRLRDEWTARSVDAYWRMRTGRRL